MYRKGILACLSLVLVCTMMLNLTGCATTVQAADLMVGVSPNQVSALEDLSAGYSAVADFAVRLFQASEESGKNTLISPLSVLCALAMTANGAEGETLHQMEDVLGMTAEKMNLYIYSYMQNLPQGGNYKLSLANSIWFTDHDRFTVNQDFLQTTADYYGADIYKAPFNEQTCKDINNWVKEKTDGMIPNALDQIPADALMYLINALAFDAEWADIYETHRVKDGEFTREDGTKQKCELMYSTESNYFEDEKATGFLKYYKGGKYAFVAMLPKEGVSVSEYIASLTGASLNAMLSNPEHTTVYASVPKFEAGYSVEMSEILKSMGMTDAFDPNRADFGGLGFSAGGNIRISGVIHKTFISVEEKGTKAAAVTIVEPGDGAAMEPEQLREVYLDRPFVYMLIDCENNIPFFIGTLMETG